MAQPLSSLELSFLALEHPNMPMHLGAVLVFGPRDDPGQDSMALAVTLRERAAAVPGLRMRLAARGFGIGGPVWVEDERFDAVRHVEHGVLACPIGGEDLADQVADFMGSALDRDRPLWRFRVLGGVAEGRTAVLVKIHQALADGLRAVELGLHLFDDRRDSAEAQAGQVLSILPRLHQSDPRRVGGLVSGPSGGLEALVKVLDPRTTRADLTRQAARAGETLRIGTAVARQLASPAPSSPLNAAVGPTRRFLRLSVDLDDVHRVRKEHGGTVNDVVLAVVAGALQSWMISRGDLPDRDVRVLVPVSRSHPDRLAGNRLSGYLLDLPTREPDALARLHAVREAMSQNKFAGPCRGPGAFPVLAELVPPRLHRLTAPLGTRLAGRLAPRLFNVVLANVPLPDIPLSVAGHPLEEVYPVVPLAPGQALALGVATYRGSLHLGLHADPAAIPDLDHLSQALAAAVGELAAASATP